MSHVPFDYNKVREKLVKAQETYCLALMKKGLVGSCKQFDPGFELKGTVLFGSYQSRNIDFTTCVDDCLKEKNCVAIDFSEESEDCYFYTGNNVRATLNANWKSVIFQSKIQSASINFTLRDSHINGGDERQTSSSQTNSTACEQSCLKDTQCDAYEYCDRSGQESWCKSTTNNCLLFSMEAIHQIEKDENSFVNFIVRQSQN